MGDCVKSVDVGSFRMSQLRGKLCEPGWLSFFLQNLSADTQVSRNVGNHLFHAEEVGIQVFCFLLGVKSKEIELKPLWCDISL